MSAITIKNIPASVYSTLKERAKAHGRSLNKEIITTLESALHSSPIEVDMVGKHARAVRESLGVYPTQKDLTH